MSSDVDNHKIIDGQADPQTQFEKDQGEAAKDFTSTKSNKGLSMEVKVYSPFHDYYDGPAFSLSAENTTGPFDILPKHHNFITLLSPCEMVLRTVKNGDQKIRISGGIMHVKADKVIIFLDV